MIENWAFGAPSNQSFIQNWHKEFHHAPIEVGTEVYMERLQQRPDWEALRQGIQDPKYLLIHITAQKVLSDIETEPLVYKTEDFTYFYHHLLRWKWYLSIPCST